MKAKVPHFLTYLLFATSVFLVYFIVFSLLPYEFYVRDQDLIIQDACVGSETVTVDAVRNPIWGIQGQSWSQVIKFEGANRIETDITRFARFGYEPYTTNATYQVTYDRPILEPGVYGANQWIVIYPLPFIEIKHYRDASENKFNVINCE